MKQLFDVNNVIPATEGSLIEDNKEKIIIADVKDFFYEALECKPYRITMKFLQKEGYLFLKLVMKCNEEGDISESFPANSKLIEAILSAFQGNMSLIDDFDYGKFDDIIEAKGDENLVLEIYKQFEGSPYRPTTLGFIKIGEGKYKSFTVAPKCFVSFWFPNEMWDEVQEAFKEVHLAKQQQNNDTKD